MKLNKIANAFYKAYSKPLPLWRILFCSFESNSEWYDKRVKRFSKIQSDSKKENLNIRMIRKMMNWNVISPRTAKRLYKQIKESNAA